MVIGASALRQAWKGNIKCEAWCIISSSLTWNAVKMSRNFLLFVPSSKQSRAFPRHPHFVWSSSQASSRGTRQGRSTLRTFQIRELLIYAQNIGDGNVPVDPLEYDKYAEISTPAQSRVTTSALSVPSTFAGLWFANILSEFTSEASSRGMRQDFGTFENSRTCDLRSDYRDLRVKLWEACDKAVVLPPYS